MKFSNLLRLSLVTSVIFTGFSAFAEDDANLLIFENKETVQSQQAPPLMTEMADEIQVKFDPSEVTEVDKEFNRERFVKKARAEMNTEIPKDVLYEFEGPRTEAELEKLLQLSDSEVASFLAKKKAFLGKFAKVLAFFRVGPAKINKALNELNGRFYESSHVVSRSNVKGGSMMFSISGGLALPQKVMEALHKRSIGSFIPKSGGFYYMLGLGAGFARKVDANNKSKFVFEVFVDVEKLKKTLTGIVEVSAAGTYGLVFEKREGAFMSQKNTTMYGGATGVFRQGSHQFGWAASTGLSFPPGIGILLVYQDEATRYYLFRTEGLKASFPALRMVKDNIVSALRNIAFNRGSLVTCQKALL
ncbi:hypothetical protein [Bdellovibrio svalbardensis]|uniref:Uncharacterized protein n=1 Tax=Bdellovibrio svalbardensis TaxID=2972972 RepID=A0ABT6DIZ6_9BACT|nr:hypothetical protein [Bdellovibrio svalbardensis]MDG0816832.1 hypothetical protein [Bdellovibrio svalbardensis]